MQLILGDFVAAEALVVETEAVTEATGSHLAPQGAILAALRGEEAEATALIDAARHEVMHRGEGLWLVATEWSSAFLFNGLGRYEEASAAAEQAVGHAHELGVSTWVPTEFIEAAVRSGHPERAAGPLRRLQEISSAAGTDWALGSRHAHARCSARVTLPRACTERRSRGWAARRYVPHWRARTWSTASGYDENGGEATRASSFGLRTACMQRSA